MAIAILSDQDYGNQRRINNLPPAVASGQPATFDQIPGLDPYSGCVYAESRPGSGVGVTQIGIGGQTVTGTLSTPALTIASYRSAIPRSSIVSAATAGSLAGLRTTTLLCWRGDAPGFGGFRYVHRFSISGLVAGNRGFVGLMNSTAAPTNVDPLTDTAGSKIGVAFNSDTGNLQLITNIAGTAPSVIDLGANFPINTTDVWKLELRCLENTSTVDWFVTKLGSTVVQSGALSSNLPGNTTFLTPQIWMTNNATALACTIQPVSWTLTSRSGAY